jgi:hypothetical protein
MKTSLFSRRWLGLAVIGLALVLIDTLRAANTTIPLSQIGAKATADYQGDGLTVTATDCGARLHCVFQRLDGEATREGLWLASTVTNHPGDRFRVKVVGVGRVPENVERGASKRDSVVPLPTLLRSDAPGLASTGSVSMDGRTVRYSRPGLVEGYTVSMDGLRQDFVVLEKPPLNSQPSTLNPSVGPLRVELAVSGARVEAMAGGARLVLEQSGRRIAYSKLHVTDAKGKELPARMEVLGDDYGKESGSRASVLECGSPLPLSADPEPTESGRGLPHSKTLRSTAHLAVVVDDAGAEYPVRIDPTFSDANWISMNPSVPGVAGSNAAVVDGSGNLYIGGSFTWAGAVNANQVVKWDGSSWSALGSGINDVVLALAVSGSDLYAGGRFTMAGGKAATNIAKWDGSSWSALGPGISYYMVCALAVSGSDLFAGGDFRTEDGTSTGIARWNGNSWCALGSGIGESGSLVKALAVSGSDLYAGGGRDGGR